MKTRFLKTRLSQSDYQALANGADAEGLTISEFARNSLIASRQAVTVEVALQEILQRLPTPNSKAPSDQIVEVAALEALFLLRELVLAQDPQALTRVNTKLDRQLGAGRTKP